jgi:glycosyltransferase involved in cell wall biosynthesis
MTNKELSERNKKIQNLVKKRQFDIAKNELRKLLSQYPKNIVSIRILHDIEKMRKNWPKALRISSHLVFLYPDNADSYIRQGFDYICLKKFDQAYIAFSKASKINIDDLSIKKLEQILHKEKRIFWENKSRVDMFKKRFFFETFFDVETPKDEGCTVVVPCYNCEKYIEQTLDSILKSGHSDLEILTIDDQSTDNTLSILKKYEKEYESIRVLQHKKNSGLAATRNTGIVYASKGFITFLDSDDLMLSGGITRRVKTIKKRRDSSFIIGSYGGSVTIKDEDILPPDSKSCSGMKIVEYLSQAGNCPFNANQPLFITNFLRMTGGFPEEKKTAEDWPFWQRLLRIGAKILPTHYYDVTYRLRPSSMIRNTAHLHIALSINYIKNIHKNDADALFSKPFSEYSTQLNFYKRFFSFWGMHLSSLSNAQNYQVSKEELYVEFHQNLIQYLPDLWAFQLNSANISQMIINGVLRFYCIDKLPDNATMHSLKEVIDFFTNNIITLATNKKNELLKNNYAQVKQHFNIAFFPHKEYHVRTAILIIDALKSFGLDSVIIDFSTYFRDEGVTDYLNKYPQYCSFSYNQFALSLISIDFAVVFNDWDPIVKSFIETLKEQGTDSIGIVEGVNDYHSVDTPGWRPAYQIVDHLLLPGKFHKKYFFNHKSLHVAGVQRLDSLSNCISGLLPTTQRPISCVINCNFTYGVLTEYRTSWLKDICDSLIKEGFKPVISRHPQDVGSLDEYEKYISNKSLYDLLPKTKIFITRFSGTVYEALLSGAHVIYYNPDIEKIDMFVKPLGAYSYIKTPEDLIKVIKIKINESFNLNMCREFLKVHCSIGEDNTSSSTKTAEIINNLFEKSKGKSSKNIFIPNSYMKNDYIGIMPTVIPPKSKVADNTLFIMGNGPSLRGLNFQRFNGHPTLGMNVAFRHWHKINWYPTYYICLDTVVTESQKDGICKLVKEQDKNGIQTFLLRKNLLKSYPKLKDNPSVLFFEDYLHSPAFEGVEPLSTGSHAALFGAMLEYKRICLLGIDCRYLQQITEAQKVDGHVLEMTSTPAQNPNYFIDDYQQKGDRFNVPDSLPDLHYQSWLQVGVKLKKLGVDVVNCNPKSRIDMFDFVDLKDILS